MRTPPKSVVVVYLRPSTVTITVTSNVLLYVLAVLVVGVVDAAPVVGISPPPTTPLIGTLPARTVTDISPVRARAKTKRFMI